MRFCRYCGNRTEGEEPVCGDCRRRAEGPAPHGPDANGSGAPADGGKNAALWQGGQSVSFGQGGQNAAAPEGAALPPNKCGILGMSFSIAGLVSLVLLAAVATAFVLRYPELAEGTIRHPVEAEVAWFVLGVLVTLLLSFGFSAAGTALSIVGLVRRRRYRFAGFAVAGLAVGAAVLLLLFLAAVGA